MRACVLCVHAFVCQYLVYFQNFGMGEFIYVMYCYLSSSYNQLVTVLRCEMFIIFILD